MPKQDPTSDGLLSLRPDAPSRDKATVESPDDLFLELLRALAQERAQGCLEDAEIIEAELLNLLAVRRLFVFWVGGGSKEDMKKGVLAGVKPTQFLRAWNDSVARVIQLLRARRDLVNEGDGEWTALIEEVYDQLEEG